MRMSVVLVVNDTDIGYSLGTKPLDDLNLVLRFTKPGAVIVKSDCAADSSGFIGDSANAIGFGGYASLLFCCASGRLAAAGNP